MSLVPVGKGSCAHDTPPPPQMKSQSKSYKYLVLYRPFVGKSVSTGRNYQTEKNSFSSYSDV